MLCVFNACVGLVYLNHSTLIIAPPLAFVMTCWLLIRIYFERTQAFVTFVLPLALLIVLTHLDQLHLLCLALSQSHPVHWFELTLLNESTPIETKEVPFSQPDAPELKIDDKQIVFNPADGLRWSFCILTTTLLQQTFAKCACLTVLVTVLTFLISTRSITPTLFEFSLLA